MDTAVFLGTAENFVYGLCSAYFIYESATYFRHRREQRFLLPEGGLLLEGVIDYLADTQNGLVLVDYKTGAPPADDEVHDGYAYQLAIYKAAAEQMYKKTVVRAELHFLQNNTRWTLPEADTYYKDALALCRKIAAKCEVQDFACNAGKIGRAHV